ncbi:MAG: FAD:protein FMN transferase [Phycisphaerae bacterium]|nr:FAD:protein FMN transferase [Phycisphaerae bacterium]
MPPRLALAAMGTRFEVVLAGGPDAFLRAAGDAALAEIEQWDRRLSLFRPDSTLAHVNRHADAGPLAVDDELFELLVACRDLHAATAGAFDPTVAPLMRALGLHTHDQRHRPPGGVPPLEAVGFNAVDLDASRRTIRFTRPGMALDLGSIAKGHALDAAADVLRDAGVECAMLQGGTSGVVAIGAPPGLESWRVRLPPPLQGRAGEGLASAQPGPRVPLVARLRDLALSVSAPGGRVVQGPDGPVTHVLDPRTGRPARVASVAAVTAPLARDADAWSTALLVDPGLAARAPATLGWAIGRDGAWTTGGLWIEAPAGVAEVS